MGVTILTGAYKELRQQMRREKKNGNAMNYVAVTDGKTGQSTMLVWGEDGSKLHLPLSTAESSSAS
ncbi:MAG: hypothetical protein JW811_07890 [Clostridiales bacterium]|nr:hypothetical protein [Clostridiales bacterium]